MARGKNVKHFNMKKDDVSDDELVKLMIGPSGNLRAPTVRRGKKLFVGFHPDEFERQVAS